MKGVPFSFLLELDPAPDFAAGLDPAAPAEVSRLILELLSAAGAEDLQRLAANYRAVFPALVRFWLCAPDAGPAENAAKVLVRSLEAGPDAWKRVLRDRDVYGLILGVCKAGCDDVVRLDRAGKSYAQTRLLEVLAQMARLNWLAVTRSHIPDVEAAHGMRKGEGLLQFAVLRMVDWRNDVGMHLIMLTFFVAILTPAPDDDEADGTTSPALEFLVDAGIHDEILRRYASDPDDDPERAILYPSLAEYVAAFAKHYPNAPSLAAAVGPILAHITRTLQAARWAQPASAVWQDLAVLAAFPPKRLCNSQSPLFLIPIATPSKAALDALGAVFHGPEGDNDEEEDDEDDEDDDAGAAREALFKKYVELHPDVIERLLSHANQPHDPDVSLAALGCLRAIVSTHSWPGARALMSLPKARLVVEFLASPLEKPEYWSNRAREVAEARRGCARALLEGMSGWEGARSEWVRALEGRVEGPLMPARRDRATMVATMGR